MGLGSDVRSHFKPAKFGVAASVHPTQNFFTNSSQHAIKHADETFEKRTFVFDACLKDCTSQV